MSPYEKPTGLFTPVAEKFCPGTPCHFYIQEAQHAKQKNQQPSF